MLTDIKELPALGLFERVGFLAIGSIFLYASYLLVSDGAWIFPALILPVAGYVTIRGIIGHTLRVRGGCSKTLATPEGVVGSAQKELTSTGRKLLALDICLGILLIILELVFAFLGTLVASIS